jgi:hypothetical protein
MQRQLEVLCKEHNLTLRTVRAIYCAEKCSSSHSPAYSIQVNIIHSPPSCSSCRCSGSAWPPVAAA